MKLLIPLLLVSLAACKFSRQAQKSEVLKDSVIVQAGSVDSGYLRKLVEESFEGKKSTNTIKETYQPFIVPGQPQPVSVLVSRESNSEVMEELRQMRQDYDSLNKKLDTGHSAAVATTEKDKKVDESLKPNLLAWVCVGTIVMFLLFGGGLLAVMRQVVAIKNEIKKPGI